MASFQEALEIAEAHGYQHLAGALALNLGFVHLMDGDAVSARRQGIGNAGSMIPAEIWYI